MPPSRPAEKIYYNYDDTYTIRYCPGSVTWSSTEYKIEYNIESSIKDKHKAEPLTNDFFET